MVQWLELCTSTVGGHGSIPGRGTKIRQNKTNKQTKKTEQAKKTPDFPELRGCKERLDSHMEMLPGEASSQWGIRLGSTASHPTGGS